MNKHIKRQFLSWMFPVVEILGSLTIPSKRLITDKDVEDCMNYLDARSCKAGLVFLSRIRNTLSNVFIPGFWGHAAISLFN